MCMVVAIHLLVVAAVGHGQLFYHLEPKPPACSNLQEGEAHVDFRLDVLHQCKGNSVRCRDGLQAVSQAEVTTSQPLSHTTERFPGSKKNCSVCEKAKKQTDKGYGAKTVWGCLVCKVHLCKGHCFVQFHQKLAQSVS